MAVSVLSGISVRDGQYRHRPIPGGLDVLVVNLMPDQTGMERQLLRAWLSVRENLNLTFTLMSSQIETTGDAAEISATYSLYEDVKDQHFDAVFVTGSPYDGQDEQDIPFWEDFVDFMAWSQTHSEFRYFAGWSAAGALAVNYGIHVPHRRKKLFGIFEQQLSPSYLFTGMVEPFLMPVSRWFSFADVRLPDELEVLSRDAVSGPGIVTNKAGTTLYVTGHPTVQGNTFHDEYEAELAAGRLTMPPTNLQYVSGRPLATWAINGTTFFENWFAFIGKALGKEQSKL